jgi:transcriptional regulator with XRE-family HTH domain
MARAAIGLSAQELADAAGVGVNTINRFEAGVDARFSTIEAIRAALEKSVEFIPENGGGAGVRLKKGEGKMLSLEERARSLAEAKAAQNRHASKREIARYDAARKIGDDVLAYCLKNFGRAPSVSYDMTKVIIRHSGFHAEIEMRDDGTYLFSEHDEVGFNRKTLTQQGMLDELLRFVDAMRLGTIS